MNIHDIKKELNLIYYGYDEDKKAFFTDTDTSITIAEFTKILDKLEASKIEYNIKDMSYIEIDV